MAGPLVDPVALNKAIRASVEARIPSAIEDATAELVDSLVAAEVVGQLQPHMGNFLEKAQAKGAKLDQNAMPVDPRGLTIDPFTALDQMGFRERPSAITYQTLNQMGRRTPPIAAILLTRINQIAAFAKPQVDEHSVGYRIVLRDGKASMTPEMEKRAAELTKWVSRCGNPDVHIKRDRFGGWLRKTGWDTLVYDQISTEIVPDRSGRPSYWRALDAATMRISDDLDETDDDVNTVQYVQVYDDTIIAEFSERELMWGVRNPRSDIKSAGYGHSELEYLLTMITAILWGIEYNSNFFKQGSVAKGMINFKGAIPQRELLAFRRHWYSMLTGVDNAWRTPIVNSDDVQWVNMQTGNKDMEFSNWMDWLLKVSCAVFQIAPEEIGFQFGNTGGGSSLNEGNQEHKLTASKDKGLVPLATFLADEIDRSIIEPLDDRFRIEFSGINARTAEEFIELQTKEVKSIKTVNESRAERDLPPLPDGDIILDSTYLQWAQGKQMQQGDDGGDAQIDDRGLDHDDDAETGTPGTPDDADDRDVGDDGMVNPAVSAGGVEDIQKSWRRPRILDLEIDV